MTSASENNRYLVFVYGTLKKGEPNHSWFSKNKEGYYKFLFEAKTEQKFPLIIGTKYNIPFLLYSPGNGTHVRGEVYEVDTKVLEMLDELEDYPDFYTRELFYVTPLNDLEKSLKVWIYVIKKFSDNLLQEPFLENYSNSGSHGRKYVERYLRDDNYNYKLEISSTFTAYQKK